jgi:hypothetical protein
VLAKLSCLLAATKLSLPWHDLTGHLRSTSSSEVTELVTVAAQKAEAAAEAELQGGRSSGPPTLTQIWWPKRVYTGSDDMVNLLRRRRYHYAWVSEYGSEETIRAYSIAGCKKKSATSIMALCLIAISVRLYSLYLLLLLLRETIIH